MARLVDDLLSLARADAGQQIAVGRVELDRVLMEVVQQMAPHSRGVALSITEIDQIQARGDADRLKQLLLILVDNALKYTPAGGEVRVALRRDDGVAAVTVADTGIGIAPSDLPHIFERFYQADVARTRGRSGAGLGLSIARWIVDQHGGEITAASGPGKGSTFTVRLPL